MSLTTRLARGELARWCEQTFAGVPNLAAAVYRQLHGAGPPVPARATEPGHQAEVNAAFTQRLGLLIDGSAPAVALLGPVAAGLARPGWSDTAAAVFGPSRLPAAISGRFSPYRRQVTQPPAAPGDPGEHEPAPSPCRLGYRVPDSSTADDRS